MNKIPFDIARFSVDITQKATLDTLIRTKEMVSGSLRFLGENFLAASRLPYIEKTTLSSYLEESGKSLRDAGEDTGASLLRAINATGGAFRSAVDALDLADEKTRRMLFENIHVASITGESFAGVKVSEIHPSYRANGEDILAEEVANRFIQSGLKKAVLLLPGLLCDETLWRGPGNPEAMEKLFASLGIFPIPLRFNPGLHFSENGKAFLELFEDIHSLPAFRDKKFHVISYSQGGLILRAALYLSQKNQSSISPFIDKAVFISSPDGGSYLEKLGFWLGLTLEKSRLPGVQMAGIIGNERSNAIKDLSHGIIRQEDWENSEKNPLSGLEHLVRYSSERYFGELDDLDAYQIYSVISKEENSLWQWVGDGIVETGSLTYLSDRVFRKKSRPEHRVWELPGLSHFQIMHSEANQKILKELLL